jgi:predicted nucleotidyltransferase
MVMTVVGYEDALAAAENVQIEPELVMRVVSLAGLVVLKLFAWEDRGHQDSRDAEDFATVLRSYAAAGNEDRLYGDSMDTMEAADFDIELAGARLLISKTYSASAGKTWSTTIPRLSPRRSLRGRGFREASSRCDR